MISSGFEPATSRLGAQRLYRLRFRVPLQMQTNQLSNSRPVLQPGYGREAVLTSSRPTASRTNPFRVHLSQGACANVLRFASIPGARCDFIKTPLQNCAVEPARGRRSCVTQIHRHSTQDTRSGFRPDNTESRSTTRTLKMPAVFLIPSSIANQNIYTTPKAPRRLTSG